MNKTIFLYSFKRFFEWHHVIFGAIVMIFGAVMIGFLWASSIGLAAEMSRFMLFGPIIPFSVASVVIMPKVANAQQRKDGEYLSLLFTRPVSRTSYVITKWLSASLFVFFVLMLEAFLASGVAWLAAALLPGFVPFRPMVDTYSVTDGVCNSLSMSALFVLLAACPYRVRFWLTMAIMTVLIIAMGSFGATILMSGASFIEASHMMATAMRFIGSLFSVSVDSYHILNAADSPLTAICIFVSNVVLYLTLASLILCHREFFYAND